MPSSLIDIPANATVLDLIVEKQLSNGSLAEIFLVKFPTHYESALFIGGTYKPGPPVPRALENPTDTAAYWMGVRPKIGLTQFEGDEILGTVNVQNKIHHCFFVDKWGASE
jgi:hypothetical protein